MNRIRVGIEIGSHTVKVVWKIASRAHPEEWRYDQRSCRNLEDPKEVASVLEDLLRPLAHLRDRAQILLVAPSCHLRVLTLTVPKLTQIPTALAASLPSVFPFELDRCHVRYQLLNQRRVNERLECSIRTVACDVQSLQTYLEILWKAGKWIPDRIFSSTEALTALAKLQGRLKGPTLIFELGARRSVIAIVGQQHVLIGRELAFGSNSLTASLMTQLLNESGQSLQLSWDQAEMLKCRVGLPVAETTAPLLEGRLPQATYQAMLQPVLEQWLSEIQRTIAFFVQQHPDAEPREVLLCGAGSGLVGLDHWLTRQLGLSVQRVSIDSILGQDMPTYTIVCGMLMAPEKSMVDLTPKPTQKTRRLIQQERWAIKVLALVLAGLWLLIGMLGLQQVKIRRQTAQAEQKLKTLSPMITLADTVAKQATLIESLSRTQEPLSVEWLKRLSRTFPSPVRLRELSVDPQGNIRMVGQAQAREESPEGYVSELAMGLSQDKLCQGVRLSSSQRSSSDSGLVNFTLTCRGQN